MGEETQLAGLIAPAHGSPHYSPSNSPSSICFFSYSVFPYIHCKFIFVGVFDCNHCHAFSDVGGALIQAIGADY